MKYSTSIKKHRFIFIGGLHRSGTSILHRVLREHPNVSGFSHTGKNEDEGQLLQDVYKPASAYGGPGRFVFHPDAYINEQHLLANKESANLLFAQWSEWFDLSKTHLIEKSPPNIIKTRFLQALFPKSSFIMILRHPICVAYATQSWNESYEHFTIQNLLEHWVRAHEIFLQDMPYLKSVYVLRYEEFVQNPQLYIDDIIAFLKKRALFRKLPSYKIKEHVDASTNEKYFEAWNKNQAHPSSKLHVARDNALESRIRQFGYSLEQYRDLYSVPWIRSLPSNNNSIHT